MLFSCFAMHIFVNTTMTINTCPPKTKCPIRSELSQVLRHQPSFLHSILCRVPFSLEAKELLHAYQFKSKYLVVLAILVRSTTPYRSVLCTTFPKPAGGDFSLARGTHSLFPSCRLRKPRRGFLPAITNGSNVTGARLVKHRSRLPGRTSLTFSRLQPTSYLLSLTSWRYFQAEEPSAIFWWHLSKQPAMSVPIFNRIAQIRMTEIVNVQTPPILHNGPSEKEMKYDRQLRLWAKTGQAALESANILLLNSGCGVVGVEVLKNLILPGTSSSKRAHKPVTETDV